MEAGQLDRDAVFNAVILLWSTWSFWIVFQEIEGGLPTTQALSVVPCFFGVQTDENDSVLPVAVGNPGHDVDWLQPTGGPSRHRDSRSHGKCWRRGWQRRQSGSR